MSTGAIARFWLENRKRAREAKVMGEIPRIVERHRLGQRNDYNDMHAMVAELERLRNILIRVNALNDSPSHFCGEIDGLTMEFVPS